MPPQSRGASPNAGQRQLLQSESMPPRLRPYLENFPSPTVLIPSDQRTPTGPRMVIPDRDVVTPTPTPRASRGATTFHMGEEDKDETEDDDLATTSTRESPGTEASQQESNTSDVSGVTLDDDDFVSHYSRRESSDSEEATDEGEGEAGSPIDEDGEEEEQLNGTAGPSGPPPVVRDRPSPLSRVHSLPARPPFSLSKGVHSHLHQQTGGLHTSQSTTSLPPLPPRRYILLSTIARPLLFRHLQVSRRSSGHHRCSIALQHLRGPRRLIAPTSKHPTTLKLP